LEEFKHYDLFINLRELEEYNVAETISKILDKNENHSFFTLEKVNLMLDTIKKYSYNELSDRLEL
jgi:hypothetical protein